MPPVYKIHPGIGIARLGNSPTEFCISPEQPAALPIECDSQGNPILSPDGTSDQRIKRFKDQQGRIKRQAARFKIFVYDESNPKGRELKLGDRIEGGGNHGTLVDIQWQVYLANKKAVWYEFKQLSGEHGYDESSHPRRNADITDPNERQRLIIDPGPRVVNLSQVRRASFDRSGNAVYSATFPPPLNPNSIDTLGEILTDNAGRLLVLGGHGNSGTFKDGFGQPRIDDYANNDGWFDDTSDGPVMARLVMYSEEVGRLRFVDVEYPAWCIVGYPAYVPEILDMITAHDVIENMGIREFATRTDIFGDPKQFNQPHPVNVTNQADLTHWRAGDNRWNPEYKPWFYRDVWPILFRPDEYTYLCNVLGISNYPHNRSRRGTFDVQRLSVPPAINQKSLDSKLIELQKKHQSGDLFWEQAEPSINLQVDQWEWELRSSLTDYKDELGTDEAEEAKNADELITSLIKQGNQLIADDFSKKLKSAVAEFISKAHPITKGDDVAAYLQRWAQVDREEASDYDAAKQRVRAVLEAQITEIREELTNTLSAYPLGNKATDFRKEVQTAIDSHLLERLKSHINRLLKELFTGKLLQDIYEKARAEAVFDPFREFRMFLYKILRLPGEENTFQLADKPNSRMHNLPLMPLLAGDNPISNTVPSKFLRLTDYQLFILKQWSEGKFYNEDMEGWKHPDPLEPYKDWGDGTGASLDQGVLMNVLGGAFCPGGEVGWVIRNPSIYREPYRIKADPAFSAFRLLAASANAASRGTTVPDADYLSATEEDLSQDSDFSVGLQPGDLTKSMALPWQADFNECTTQMINVTYDQWNTLNPGSEKDKLLEQEEKLWETLWWPAHRPLQTFEVVAMQDGAPAYQFLTWARGIPQTNAGDLKMVTSWSDLGFVIMNPFLSEKQAVTPSVEGVEKYISVERNPSAETTEKQ